MKKILILGGASPHNKLIKEAREMGLYTIVTDNVPVSDSPGKQLADENWNLNIKDVEGIVQKCREEHVSAVISGWVDPSQVPYAEICRRLNIPSYATPQNTFIMTNKQAFKDFCIECGVDIIPEYTKEDMEEGKIIYPVYVKPTDSRGSRGQNICRSREELLQAIEEAKGESSDQNYVLEKYLYNCPEIHLTYFVIDGEPHINRIVDVFGCDGDRKLRKVLCAGLFPSHLSDVYMRSAHPKVVSMIRKLGMKDGPIYLQGFYDQGVFRFFDMGIRFSGCGIESASQKATGVNLTKAMLEIALTGKSSIKDTSANMRMNGKIGLIFYLLVGAGRLKELKGVEEILENPNVLAYMPRKSIGETVEWSYDVRQYLAEIVLLADNVRELKKTVDFVHETVKAYDENGHDMIISRFDVNRILSERP